MPAISATTDESADLLSMSASGFSDFTEEKGMKLEGDMIKSTATVIDVSDDGNSVTVQFNMKYSCNDTSKITVSAEKPYLYYYIDPRIKESMTAEQLEGMTGRISDGSGGTNGDYLIDFENNRVIIKPDNPEKLQIGFSGDVFFNATVQRKDEESSTYTEFTIGTQTVKVQGFTEKELTIAKTGNLETDGRTITWSVTVDNPNKVVTDDEGNVTYEPNSLKDYTITDTMFGGDTTVTSNPANAGSYDPNTKTYTFNDISDNQITLTYTTTLTADQLVTPRNNNFDGYGEVTNSVSIVGPNDPEKTASVTVPYELGYKIEKHGEVDYSKNPVEINWTIDITNKYNLAVDDLKLYDSMFAEYVNGDISKITFEPSDKVTGSFSEDKTKIILESVDANNEYTGDVTIKYTTQAKDGTTSYDNEAQLEKDVPFVKTTASVSTTPFNFSKYGYNADVNTETGKLNYWKIGIDNISVSASSLNNYYIIDDNFSDERMDPLNYRSGQLDSNNFIIYCNLNGVQTKLDENYYTIDGDKLTFKGFAENDTLTWISIEYWTNPSQAVTGDEFTESFTDTNNAEIFNENGKSFGTGSADITWTPPTQPDDPVETYGVNKNYTESNLIADENNIIEIPWQIELTQQNGTFAGKTVTDTVSVPSGIEGVDHYITDEQFGNIKVTSNGSDIPNEYYTITSESSDDKTVSFTITFADNEALADYSSIYVTYNTTAKVEGVEKGQTVNFNNAVDFSGKTSNPSYPYENVDTSVAPYTKYDGSVDISLQTANGTTKKTQLEVVTLDGIEYYKVDYLITVNDKNKFSGAFTLVDTFPAGFGYYDMGGIQWVCSNGAKYDIAQWTRGDTYVKFGTDDDGNNYLIIALDPNYNNYKSTLSYSLITPKEDFDKKLEAGGVEIVNKLVDGDAIYPEVTQTQKFEEAVITKKEMPSESAGFIQYQVDVNPEGLALSNDGHLILTDIMKTVGEDPSVIKAYLQSLEIYTKDSDGNYTVLLDPSKYNYVLDNNPTVAGDTETELDTSGISFNGSRWVLPSNVSGGKYKVSVSTNDPNTEMRVYVKNGGNDAFGSPIKFTTDSSGNGQFEFDADVSGSFELGFDFYYGDGWSRVDSITFDKISTVTSGGYPPYTAKMILTVPDEMPLRIQYKYMGINPQKSDSIHVNEEYAVTNTVEVKTSFMTEDSKVDTDFIIDTNSGASLTPVRGLVTLQKVDVGDYSVKLDADFNIYKYDTVNGWIPAVSVEEVTSNDNITHKVTWAENSDEKPTTISVVEDGYNIQLDDGCLYKLVEVRAPDGYVSAEESKTEKYFSAGIYSGTVPDEAKDFTVVTASGTLNIQNYKNISVGARKIWADGNNSHSDVTVKLYKSSVLMTGSLPEDSAEVAEATLGQSNNWYYKWENLPSGTSDGKPIYYYVKEEAYTENGKAYTAFYVGNGTNKDVTIEITNTSGLAVKKIWHDYEGEKCEPLAAEIKFKVFRSTTQVLDGSLPSVVEEWTAGEGYSDGYYTLNSDNDWTMTFSNADPYVTDDNSKPYYYYVVEDTSNLTDNRVSYIGNGCYSTGLITITNKSTKIVIGHMPETGSIGTAWFFVAGGVLAIGALAALRVLRRRLSDQS